MPRAKKTGERHLSAYNRFIKSELPRIKKENPDMNHKEAFKMAAHNWSTSPSNPKSADTVHKSSDTPIAKNMSTIAQDESYPAMAASVSPEIHHPYEQPKHEATPTPLFSATAHRQMPVSAPQHSQHFAQRDRSPPRQQTVAKPSLSGSMGAAHPAPPPTAPMQSAYSAGNNTSRDANATELGQRTAATAGQQSANLPTAAGSDTGTAQIQQKSV